MQMSVRLFDESLSRALNLSQVSLRSLLDLSELTSSVRRSLKYFVLFFNISSSPPPQVAV